MPIFKYVIRDRDGNESEGEMQAANRLELARNLRAEGNIVLSVKELKKGSHSNFIQNLVAKLNRVSLKEKIIFGSNLSAMIDAGLTLSRALGVMERQTKNPKLRNIIKDLIKDVDSGKTFSKGLSRYPNIFPPIFISMVRAGEESGNLPKSLKIVSEQMMKTYELRRKIKSAMIYPIIVVTVIIVIGILMMIYLVPTLSATFKDLGAELPLSTQIIISTSEFLQNNILIFLIGVFILGASFWRILKTKKGKKIFSFTLLHLPAIKGIVKQSNAALTMRTLSSLVSAGVGLVHGLEITSDVVQNPYYVEILQNAQKQIQKGSTLASQFTASEEYYPAFVAEMVQVGEETGKLSEMLLKGAEFYEGEVDAVTKNLSTIVEPVLMVVIGIAVGFFAISMIQPLYSLSDII